MHGFVKSDGPKFKVKVNGLVALWKNVTQAFDEGTMKERTKRAITSS
jgi:hypothetical protein